LERSIWASKKIQKEQEGAGKKGWKVEVKGIRGGEGNKSGHFVLEIEEKKEA